MTQAMHEEYHRYATPEELKAMGVVEDLIRDAATNVFESLDDWGFRAYDVDGQGFMSSNDEYTEQTMFVIEDLDKDEVQDLQSQLQLMFDNELSTYPGAPEIKELSCSVVLPDHDLTDAEDDANGITRGSLMFYVTFARDLF